MEITLDFSRLIFLADRSPLYLSWYVFIHGGWTVFLFALLIAFSQIWLKQRRKKFLEGIEYSLLAIDIPKDNEQSLLAVEQIYVTLAGIKSGPNLWEKYWLGKTQLSFSLELISLEGYIQFLIRTPVQFRDLVESAIYAQYPEVEITEIDDYVDVIPEITEENSEMQMWGTELCLNKESAYPLKTYKLFEHSLSQSFVDPMSSLLEVMSKLGQGEQLGLQIVIAPVGDDWKIKGASTVKNLIGEEAVSTKHIGDKMIDTSAAGIQKFSETVFSLWGDIKPKEEKKKEGNKYGTLTVNQKMVVELIENKLAKTCFASTIRIYYLAHKDVFHRGRGVSAIMGALNQFNSFDLNALKKYGTLTTDRDYFFVRQRVARAQKKLVKLFKKRSREGSPEFYLSTEELATIFHFPTITVKAPLLAKIGAKKAEPPVSLPLEESRLSSFFKTVPEKEKEVKEEIFVDYKPAEKQVISDGKIAKPFVIKESLNGYDFDNDYFENKFGKNKSDATSGRQETPDLAPKEEKIPTNLPFAE